MTRRLYYDDAYLMEFDAVVTAEKAGGWIALDQSAFYPTSGGQPFDTGVIRWDGGEARVTDVEAEDGVVWHRLDGAVAPGSAVHGAVHWPRRLDHMQQHAADHLLAGGAWQMFGAVTIGLHIGREDSSIDMQLPDGRTRLTREETDALEDWANRRVQMDEPIRCWFPGEGELETLPLRKQPTVTGRVRVVAIGDHEMVPCGGTHPSTTGQIGPVRIVSTAPARGKLRLTFLAGMRAANDYRRAARCADQVAAALNAGVEDAPEALQRERALHAAQRKELNRRLTQAALQIIRSHRRGDVYAAHLEFGDVNLLTQAAAELIQSPGTVCLLSCPGKQGRALVFARGASIAMDMAALLRRAGGRGGGKPDMAQGSAPDDGSVLSRAAEIVRNEK